MYWTAQDFKLVKDHDYMQLDGRTSARDRERAIKEFGRARGPPVRRPPPPLLFKPWESSLRSDAE